MKNHITLVEQYYVQQKEHELKKNTCQIEHSRHRSFDNFLGNLIAGLTAYSFLDSKPSIKIQRFLPIIGIS